VSRQPPVIASINRNWLGLGLPSAGQQAFGNGLLRKHDFIVIPGTVTPHSWNLTFEHGPVIGARMALLPTVVTHQLAGVKNLYLFAVLRQAPVLTSPPTIPTASP
jgi:hypothetical protein